MPASRVEIVAHRGAHLGRKQKENTIDAFRKAIELGCDYIETDVLQTKDGVLVCFHDRKIDAIPISRLTLQQLLKKTKRKGIELCLFKEYVSLYPKIRLDIEIKETGYEESIWALIKDIPTERYVVKSFNELAIQRMRRLSREIRLGYLLGKIDHLHHIERAQKELHLEFISPKLSLIDRSLSSLAERLGLTIWPWTIRSAQDHQILENPQVAALVTDIPSLSRVHLQK